MQSKALKPLVLEILISTMHRKDFSFLEQMFPHEHYSTYNLLIINQTTDKNLLVSDLSNINVINCFEFGVPKSRNLAIENATGDLCLMADDDIIYQPNLNKIITNAYLKYPKAAMISFQAIDEQQHRPYTDYYPEGIHNKETLTKIYTWVISFNRKIYKSNNINYSSYFGFGAVFKGCEEYVFLRNAYDKGLKMVHVAQTIVQHPNESSGKLMGSDNSLFARAALAQRFYGRWSYLWLVKFVFFIYRHGYITVDQIPAKYNMGLKGISKYKSLQKSGEIEKIHDS